MIQDNILTLEDAIRQYFGSEYLTGENKYYCETCKKKNDAIKNV